MKPKCVLLFSGGLDSSSLLFWAKKQNLEILPLFINYGQVSFPGEWASVQYLLEKADMEPISPLEIRSVYALGDRVKTLPQDQYFPSRNLLLLTLAAMYAYKSDATLILIGLIADVANTLPDCSPSFINKAQAVMQVEFPDIKINAPFINRKKIDIVIEAMSYGLEPDATFCCNKLPDHHCWSCPSCLDRRKVIESI